MTTSAIPAFSEEASYRRYLAGLLAGDPQPCREVFQQWLDSEMSIRDLYSNLVQPSLYEVGRLWELGEISVATEHLATAITESLLNLVAPRLFSGPRCGKSAVVACAPNEHHQIGARLVADHFELNGWRSFFLGANTPARDLASLIAEKRPDVAALSLTLPVNLDALINEVREIREAFSGLPILVGGQAFRQAGRDLPERLPGLRLLTSLADLEEWIKNDGHAV